MTKMRVEFADGKVRTSHGDLAVSDDLEVLRDGLRNGEGLAVMDKKIERVVIE